MSNGTSPVDPSQVSNLSDELLQLSMQLVQIRVTNSELSDSDAQHLGTIARQLDELSDELNAAAIGQILQNIKSSMNDIIQTTKDAQAAIKTGATIQKVFSIAGAALNLASAFVAGSVSGIVAAAGALSGTIGGGNQAASASAAQGTG